jgi:hypothetical protein
MNVYNRATPLYLPLARGEDKEGSVPSLDYKSKNASIYRPVS